MDLLERERALVALEAAYADAARGEGRMVLLGGEAGVGKTALVNLFLHGHGRDARVLLGACDPLATPRPLGPVVDIAATVGGSLESLVASGGTRDQVLTGLLAELLRRGRPNIVVLEDVHWADNATMDMLRYLGRRIGAARALVIATYRTDELGTRHPLSIVLGDLATAPAVSRLRIEPLSERAVWTLARGRHDDPAGLYHATGGNPFFVTEAIAAGLPGIPASVRDAVLARASRLSPAARSLLEAAAVIGPRSDLALVTAIEPADRSVVDECIALGMLVADGGAVGFRHELARAALVEGIPSHRRTDLHRAVVERLRSRTPNPDELALIAYHAEEAGDVAAVLEYAPAAAWRAAQLHAHREAAAQYARALRFAAGLSPEERAELLEQRAYECNLTDQAEEGIVARKAALEIWRAAGMPMKIGENLRHLSRLCWRVGDAAEAERAGQEALAMLEPLGDSVQLAWAYSNLAQLRSNASRQAEAFDWGAKAVALAEQFGDHEMKINALASIGTAKCHEGDDGTAELEQSLELALAEGFAGQAARCYVNLSDKATLSHRFADANRWIDEGLAYCAERDLDSAGFMLLGHRSWMLLLEGRWSEAADAAAEVLALPRLTTVLARIIALRALATVRFRRGDPEYWPLLDEALALSLPTDELQNVGPTRVARAEAAFLAGDVRRALEECRAAFEQARGRRHPWYVGEMAVWLHRAGNFSVALDEIRDEIATPYALEMQGDWRAAAARWRRLESPYEAAWALMSSGDEAALREALSELQALGARPAGALAARRLRDLGARDIPRGHRSATRGNPFDLTDRELEVLDLIGEGLRNVDIARKLFLTPKTVDHHVSSILGKIGVRSRLQAVQAMSSNRGSGR